MAAILRHLLPLAIVLWTGQASAADPLVTQDWLGAHLSDLHVVVLDLRPAAVHAAGHVPGAIQADYDTTGWRAPNPEGAVAALPPLEQIGATIAALGVGDADHVVLIGDSFAAAARVYWTFKVLGHSEVSIVDGGFRMWRRPIERGTGPTPAAATFTPRYDPRQRAMLRNVVVAAGTGAMALVDARPQSQWSGIDRSPVVRKAGHLPGAVWVDQAALLGPDGRLKDNATLAAMFGAVGTKPAIAYCNTGQLGAADWFVPSEVLNHPKASLYDGSMSEWTADPSRPVVRETASGP